MLYHLLYPLHEIWSPLNVFRYITFRSAGAILTAMLCVFALGPFVIQKLRALQIGQPIREEGPKAHHAKTGTPTMGGLLILAAVAFATLLWADLRNPYAWFALVTTLAFGAIGFLDDYRKAVQRRSQGLSPRAKFSLQILAAAAVGAVLVALAASGAYSTSLQMPFFKEIAPKLGWLYVPFAVLVLTSSSNAVNLTDGLDGLAVGSMLIVSATYTVLAYVAGHAIVADYLHVVNIKGAGEVTVFCASLVGACLGFLWYNAHPAEIFMGDTGALALGGAVGVVALIIKQEILLILVGGLFVVEALSVILQVASFRLRGQRLFKMAPLHHHFELSGWPESKIVIRFWILSIIFSLASLSTLKVR
jgi:phospho-N-acetylmuramoyl-pentapeptide-transferase